MARGIDKDGSFRRHVSRTLALALPIVMTRIGIIGLSTVDVLVLGRAGERHLADYVLGETVYGGLVAVMAGLVLGVPVLTARLVGEGREAATGAVWRHALLYGFLVGSAFTLLLLASPWLFSAGGYEAEAARRAGRVAAVIGFTMPFVAVYFVSASYLEAVQRPGPGFAAIALANLGNLGLNLLLVFGAGPVPAMGAVGCALATVINTALLAAGLSFYVRYRLPGREKFGIGRPEPASALTAREQRRIGYSAGASYALEAGAFTALTLFVGYLGITALAAHGILFQFLAFTFMIAYGIAGATQVRVGNAWGRGDPLGMAMAGWSGLALAVAFTLPVCLVYLAFADVAIGLFTADAVVRSAAAPVLIWMILALLTDGGQTVMNSACRGRGDTWVPTLLHLASYWGVMVPGALVLVFPLGQGLAGIYQAILIASVFSFAALAMRFEMLRRRRDQSTQKSATS